MSRGSEYDKEREISRDEMETEVDVGGWDHAEGRRSGVVGGGRVPGSVAYPSVRANT